MIKKAYRRTVVSSLPELEKVVEKSSIAGKNIPMPTIDSTGKRHVVWYNWNEFLSKKFCTIPGISQYHHFQFDSSTPGIDTQIKIVKDDVTIDVIEMPEIITPPGMSLDRQKYLYEMKALKCITLGTIHVIYIQ